MRRIEALEELREALNLESLPLRIECFDISTAMGQDNVGSMVVFEDAVAKKAHYRKFAVRGQVGMDDFAAMAEVIERRFARARRTPADRDYDEGFAKLPNLVVIDGGKGQLSAALAAMQRFDLPRVAVIALAKREEEVFVPGPPGPDPALAARSRPAAPPADPGRGSPLRARLPPAAARHALVRVDLRRPRRRRAGAAARAAPALRLRRSLPRGVAGGARGRARACRRRRRGRSTRSCTRRDAPNARGW